MKRQYVKINQNRITGYLKINQPEIFSKSG